MLLPYSAGFLRAHHLHALLLPADSRQGIRPQLQRGRVRVRMGHLFLWPEGGT